MQLCTGKFREIYQGGDSAEIPRGDAPGDQRETLWWTSDEFSRTENWHGPAAACSPFHNPLPDVLVICTANVLRYSIIDLSLSMDHDDIDDGWESLGHDLQLLILSVLKQRRDKVSLQAMMQTSRDLRLLASSLISAIEIRGPSALARYPRHAAPFTSMRLRMNPDPEEAHMETPFMVFWLETTSAAFSRLASVTSIRMELPGMLQPDEEDEAVTMDPATTDNLLASIARACPSLRCLRIDGIVRRHEEPIVVAMCIAIGQHLPGIIELQLELASYNNPYGGDFDFDIAGIDWAACLPRGLQKFTSKVNLHHELLQQLVLMPALTEVAVWSLSIGRQEEQEVQSEACAWRILSLGSGFPTCREMGRFTAAMPLLHLYHGRCRGLDDAVQWRFMAAEGLVSARAAAWLSKIRNCPKELYINGTWLPPDAATAAVIISSLTPLAGQLVSLELGHWQVSEQTLDEIADALPNVHELKLWSCPISDSAWARMASLTSVTGLTARRPAADGVTIPLAHIIASAASRPMALTFRGGSVSVEDQAGWEAFEEEQRRNNGPPLVTVRITQDR